jgi:DNA-binding beta-propeller fold protein YncE
MRSFPAILVPVALGAMVIGPGSSDVRVSAAQADRATLPPPPTFRVDPAWPTIPNNWQLGQVSSVSIDGQDHVWVLQRPGTLEASEKPRAAPPLLEFDPSGRLVQAWGGPGQGYDWPTSEHGVYVDPAGFVWIGGNGQNDHQILKFTRAGRFVMQIGRAGRSKGNADTENLNQPADAFVYAKTNELFVADGYGNRRVIVFDSETGAYKRHWGAYGNKPNDDKQPAYDPAAPPSQQFANPVHCAKPSKDGQVYVCDRTNNRIQVFKKDGTFVTEWFYDKSTLGAGAVWDLNFWPDADQTWLFNIDGENNLLRILQRSDGKVVGGFGRSGRNAGHFHWVHSIAVDSKGNIYTGEVDTGKRVQKFKPDRAP